MAAGRKQDLIFGFHRGFILQLSKYFSPSIVAILNQIHCILAELKSQYNPSEKRAVAETAMMQRIFFKIATKVKNTKLKDKLTPL